MPLLSPKIETKIHKMQEFWFSKVPKYLQGPVLILILIVAILGTLGLISWAATWATTRNQQSEKRQGNNQNSDNKNADLSPESNHEMLPHELPGLVSGDAIKQNITDFHDWKNYGKFDPSSENSQILYPTFSAFFPEGRTMYSPFIIDSRFKVILTFKPLSINRANTEFIFGNVFQCIIGNGNYKHIDCGIPPYNTNYLIEKKQQQEHPWVNRPTGVKPMTTQFLTVTSEPVADSELLNVMVSLKFIPANSEDGQYKVENFEYDIPTASLSDIVQGEIGLGIIDPEKYRQYQSDKAGFELDSLEIY